MGQDDSQSSWLIVREPVIRNLFVLIFVLGFVGGVLRFLFPFQIVNLGGSESLVSWGSSLSSIGQVIGLIVLSKLIGKQRSALVVSGVLLTILGMVTGFAATPDWIVFARIAEGAGAGLLTIIIIRISSGFESYRGESVGTLLSAVFLGSAIGQGSAGILIGQLETVLLISQTEAIMTLGFVLTVVSFLMIISLIPFIGDVEQFCVDDKDKNHGHSHTRIALRSLLSKKLLILLAIYILYDFSHGLYTPGLSLMINSNGVSVDQIGLGYLIGDAVWGASQLFTGRFVDRTGSIAPLAISLVAKGFIVVLYPFAASFMVLTSLLAIAGLSEGFLEPARNDAAMELTPTNTTVHSHRHYFIGHAPGNPFSITSHDHEHTHESGSDEIVSLLQTIGIIGFAFGSSGGGWLLSQGSTLVDLVFMGGFILVFAGILTVGLRSKKKAE
ncbi:MAG: MFS transporter [Candidatus Thorarchaeota archaeon]|nr:MFS transporter [Candidatus Thorarchaeota archaeon]